MHELKVADNQVYATLQPASLLLRVRFTMLDK